MQLQRPLGVLTPTLDGDVLAVLARAEADLTASQVHHLLGRFSDEGVRKVLARLSAQGVVLRRRVGNVYAYTLNRDHLAAEPILALTRIREVFVARLREHIAGWAVQPVYAAVFGSAARGEMRLDSDVDLLFVHPDTTSATAQQWDAQMVDVSAAVHAWLGNDVRPLTMSVAHVEERGRLEPVLRDVVREGLVLAGDRAWLVRRVLKGASDAHAEV